MKARILFLTGMFLFSLAGCVAQEDLLNNAEDHSNENSVEASYSQNDQEDNSIPYDPNAPDYVVHELKPVEVDFQMRSKYIKEHPILGNEPIPIIKWIRQEDRLKYLYKCMRSKGINVRMNEGGCRMVLLWMTLRLRETIKRFTGVWLHTPVSK